MKKTILIALISCLSVALSAQVYKLEPVFEDNVDETYLSHWNLLDARVVAANDTFALWGYHQYFDSRDKGAYEVQYFKGSAKEMYRFLYELIAFTDKYRDMDKVETRIRGVKVRTFKQLGFRYTLVFDREEKVMCMYNQRQWSEMLKKMSDYCALNTIVCQ